MTEAQAAGAADVLAVLDPPDTTPVVLVPAGPGRQPPRLRRVLLLLDGTARSAAAVAAVAERFALGGAELVVLHVFGPAWSQRLEPGRAPVVRRAVLDAQVPVMLIPISPG